MNHPTTRPEKPGVYLVEGPIPQIRTETKRYAYWNGVVWCPAVRRLADTTDFRYRKLVAHVQNKPWKEIP